jgi:hypothetical protein
MKIDEQNKTLQVLKKASQRAEENGTSNMTLDEINNEISEARKNY